MAVVKSELMEYSCQWQEAVSLGKNRSSLWLYLNVTTASSTSTSLSSPAPKFSKLFWSEWKVLFFQAKHNKKQTDREGEGCEANQQENVKDLPYV